MDKSFFVTGYSGWMGRYIMPKLMAMQPKNVFVLQHTKYDITNFAYPDHHIDYIIHLAPGPIDRVIHCAQYYDATVLFTSSGAVYEQNDNYARQKRENEQKLMESGINAKIARCFTFAGAGIYFDRGSALGNFIKCCMDNVPIRIWGDGKTIRSYLHMADCADWLLKILLDGEGIYDVGSDEAISIYSLARLVRKITRKNIDILMETHDDDERQRVYLPDIRRAEELGCKITIPLEKAIRSTWRNMDEVSNL
jgi:dTDP-glucose 4,6-dehydratase